MVRYRLFRVPAQAVMTLVMTVLAAVTGPSVNAQTATIDDYTEYRYDVGAGPIGSYADYPVTRCFSGPITSLRLTIVSGDADDIGYVGSRLVTNIGSCAGIGHVQAPIDVTDQVQIVGGNASFLLRARENCCCVTGWGNEGNRLPARFHWEVTYGTDPAGGPIEITDVMSLQFPGNYCNTVNRLDNKYLMMGARSGKNATIAAVVNVTPASIRPMVRVGVRRVGSTAMLGVAPVRVGRTTVNFQAEDGPLYYEVIAWCDDNKDGQPQQSEGAIVFPPKILVVTAQDYADAERTLSRLNWAPLSVAGALLETFRTNNALPILKLSKVNRSTTTITTVEPGLTHKTGARWRADCTAVVRMFEFPDGSFVSRKVASAMSSFDYFQADIDSHQAEIDEWFAREGGAPFESPDIDDEDAWTWKPQNSFSAWTDPDLFAAFHGVDWAAGKFQVKVERGLYGPVVTEIRFQGSFEDLYDFNNDAYWPAPVAAKLQAGYGTLGHGGHIFKSRVLFSGQFNLLP